MKDIVSLVAATALSGLLTLFGCATYRSVPLPDAKTAALGPDLERVKVVAESFDHPLLQPVAIDLSDGLSPDEAAVLAVLANPDLVAVRDTHEEAAAQLVTAGLLPNPDFSSGIDRPHGAGSHGTVNALSMGLSVDVSRLVGRAARVAAASASLEAVDLGIAWQEWQVAQAARLATIRPAMLERRLTMLADQIEAEEETIEALESAVADFDATIGDLGVHRGALEGLLQRRGDLEREDAAVRAQLNRLLGLDPTTRLEVLIPEDVDFPALPPADQLVLCAVSRRLDLRALEFGFEAQEGRVRDSVSAQFPSLSVGIATQRDESALKFLGGFVTLELPLFDHNQGVITGARATRTRLMHEYEARIATLRSAISKLRVEDALLAGQVDVARHGIEMLSGVEAAEHRAVARGDVSQLVWQQVRSDFFDLRQKLEMLLQARFELRVALATALGGMECIS